MSLSRATSSFSPEQWQPSTQSSNNRPDRVSEDPSVSGNDENEDDSSKESALHDINNSSQRDPLADARSAIRKKTSASGPVRRRISRACDQCNQLRTKCDGQNPCAHCIGESSIPPSPLPPPIPGSGRKKGRLVCLAKSAGICWSPH